MKSSKTWGVLTICLVTLGCAVSEDAKSTADPVIETWRKGDQSKAISDFLATDWSSRPLFESGSPIDQRENDFAAAGSQMNEAERKASLAKISQLLQPLDQVGEAVVKAGLDAFANGNREEARRHFTAVKQCGLALDREDYTTPVKVLGVKFRGLADTKIAKMESDQL